MNDKDLRNLHFDTLQIHAGLTPDSSEGSRGVAIHPTAAYRFESCDYAAGLFELTTPGNIYSRIQNPTVSAYEQRIAALYGGVGALAVSSGMAGVFLTLASLARAGENIVASPCLYGGTYNLYRISIERLGVEVRIAPTLDPKDFETLIDENTRAVYCESMGNPTCAVPDLEALAEVARRAKVPFVVDNTFGAGGYLCNPLHHGANIVVDSATKWINGHGTAMGGIIVDGGTFDWDPEKYPTVAGKNEGYHGLDMKAAFGSSAFIVHCRVDGLRDFGTCPSPFDAWCMLIGLETLSLRAQRQIESTRRLAEYCASAPQVKSVSYVGFSDHPSYTMAQKYFRDGGAAVFTLELKGDIDSTVRFVESLKLFAHMTMVGDSISVVTHPASTTHKQLGDADKLLAGVTPTLLRISVGLEDVDDLIADFEQAFSKTGL